MSHNTILTKLDLQLNKIGNEGAKDLRQNSTLRLLFLMGNHDIGDEGAKALSQNNAFRKLALGNTKISDEGAKAFEQNKTLTELTFYESNISKEVRTHIEKMLKQNKKRKREEIN